MPCPFRTRTNLISDVPSPIDFHDPVQARAWETDTIARKPWRPEFFAAFAAALKNNFVNFPSPPGGEGRAPALAQQGRTRVPGEGQISVLELGSGPGHLARVILSDCPEATYCALDFSETMHGLARERLGSLAARVQFIARDFRKPDWRQGLGPFDAVVTMQAAHELRHKRHLPKLLSRIINVLTPGGVFLYCDHYAEGGRNPDLMLTRDNQPRALEQAGFSDVRRMLDKVGMALYSAHRR